MSQQQQQQHQTGLLHGVCFNKEDVLSTAPHNQLRSDAVAVAIQHGIHDELLMNSSSSLSCSSSICIIDPNVVYLMMSMNSCRLGPFDAMTKASKIFVPITNFDCPDITNASLHWTLLILEKKKTNDNENDEDWFPPIHIDSLVRRGMRNEVSSVNQSMAIKAVSLIISSLSSNNNNNNNNNKYTPIVYPSAPQQKNAVDCGVFTALALRDVVRMMVNNVSSSSSEVERELYLSGRKSIFFDDEVKKDGNTLSLSSLELRTNLNWSYNQEVATEFKKEVHAAMSNSLGN